ncbi:MAG: oligosaccharide flippase family protein [Candidatus Pacebacteria bacterium]|nr:oligosaccharide flippase family protein [Candidatus Paceibacterota bacterium]
MVNITSADTTDEVQEVGALDQLELDEIKSKSVAGAASYFARTILLNFIGIAASIVLTFYLSPEDFGIFGYVIQFIGILTFFSDIGLAASLIQMKTTPTLTDYRTTFTVQQILSWLIFLATVGIAKSSLVEGNAVWILLALGISFPLASLKTISAIKLERKLDFSKLVVPQIVEQIVFNGLLIFMVFNGYGVISYAYAIFARAIVGTTAMFIIKPWKIGLELNLKALKSLINFGGKFQINDLLARVKDNLFQIILFRFMSPTDYGYMSWAKTWSMYPYNLTVNNVMAITFPTFSRLQNNKDALRKAIEKSLFFITLVIFPLIAGMSLFITPLTHVIPKFVKWQPAIISFTLFSLSIGWSAISSPLTNTLNAIGKIDTTLRLMVMWTALTWLVTPVMIYFFGFNGVALAGFLISFTSFLPVVYVKKLIPINFMDQVWRQFGATIAMAVVGLMGMNIWKLSIKHMLAGIILSGLTYLLSFVVIGRHKLIGELGSIIKNKSALRKVGKLLWVKI